MLGRVLNALQVRTYNYVRQALHHSCFTWGVAGRLCTERLYNLPKVKQLISDTAAIGTHSIL